MKSKKDRLNDSFDIIIEVIKDIITNRNSVENPLNKISVKDYNKVLKNCSFTYWICRWIIKKKYW